MLKRRLLSTKELSLPLIRKAEKAGIQLTVQKFISIHPILTEETYHLIEQLALNQQRQYIAFTSANAVDAVCEQLNWKSALQVADWKIFCLSGKTAASLRPPLDRSMIIATAPDASGLAAEIISSGIGKIVFFCGNRRMDTLPALTEREGIVMHEIEVYETRQTPQVIREEQDAVLFFSPSAVNSFFSVNKLATETVCFAIGSTTAGAISEHTENPVIISPSPDEEAALNAVISYFKQH